MTELVPYEHNEPIPSSATAMERAADFTTWAPKLQSAAAMAREICQTDFVPAALRGKPAAVTAAILAGSEMNIGPMASLMHVHMIDGRPSLSAEMQRALVLALGHRIRYREMSSTRCVVDGQRRGEDEWTTVTWTMDDAKAANLNGKANWRRYPRRMLAARATGELCRMLFADALAGMPFSVEELEDESDDVATTTDTKPVEAPKRRTAKRRTSTSTKVQYVPPESTGTATVDATPPAAPEPPLPGEPGYDEPAEPVTGDAAEDTGGATKAQLTRLHTTMSKIGIEDRAERLRVAATIVGRPLSSSTEMGIEEAGVLIDTLSNIASSDDPRGNLDALMVEMSGGTDDEPVDAELVDDDQDGAA